MNFNDTNKLVSRYFKNFENKKIQSLTNNNKNNIDNDNNNIQSIIPTTEYLTISTNNTLIIKQSEHIYTLNSFDSNKKQNCYYIDKFIQQCSSFVQKNRFASIITRIIFDHEQKSPQMIYSKDKEHKYIFLNPQRTEIPNPMATILYAGLDLLDTNIYDFEPYELNNLSLISDDVFVFKYNIKTLKCCQKFDLQEFLEIINAYSNSKEFIFSPTSLFYNFINNYIHQSQNIFSKTQLFNYSVDKVIEYIIFEYPIKKFDNQKFKEFICTIINIVFNKNEETIDLHYNFLFWKVLTNVYFLSKTKRIQYNQIINEYQDIYESKQKRKIQFNKKNETINNLKKNEGFDIKKTLKITNIRESIVLIKYLIKFSNICFVNLMKFLNLDELSVSFEIFNSYDFKIFMIRLKCILSFKRNFVIYNYYNGNNQHLEYNYKTINSSFEKKQENKIRILMFLLNKLKIKL